MQSNWAAELSPLLPDGPILELCAGAGHIGLLAAALTRRRIVQVDADPNAAVFACDNARAAGISRAHEFRVARLDAAVARGERFPLILADPPYIPTSDVAAFPEDPLLAIDGGEDGLELTRACLDVIAAHLTPGGAALLQVRGPSQADDVARTMQPGGGKLLVSDTRVVDSERAVMKLQRVTERAENGYLSPAFRREGLAALEGQ